MGHCYRARQPKRARDTPVTEGGRAAGADAHALSGAGDIVSSSVAPRATLASSIHERSSGRPSRRAPVTYFASAEAAGADTVSVRPPPRRTVARVKAGLPMTW